MERTDVLEIGDRRGCILVLDQGPLLRKRLEQWRARGFLVLSRHQVRRRLQDALDQTPARELAPFWRALYGSPFPSRETRRVVDEQLLDEACQRYPRLLVLAREVSCNRIVPPPELTSEPQVAPRLETEHYLAVEALDEQGKPVAGVRLELLIAGGELKAASTASDGLARVDGIQAGRAVVRVRGMDGGSWRPDDGEPSQESSSERPGWHMVRQGECLTSIAQSYGITDWKRVWDDPRNDALRKKRKSPHVLRPGDQLAIPPVKIHEITRPTDATHRIVLRSALTTVRLRLRDAAGEAFAGLTYDYQYVLGEDTVEKPGSKPTDGDGWLEETIPTAVRSMIVTLRKPRLSLAFELGCLDPTCDEEGETVHMRGVGARLQALGYATGEVRDEPTPSEGLAGALALLQRDELGREAPTGEPDRDTLSALERLFGA